MSIQMHELFLLCADLLASGVLLGFFLWHEEVCHDQMRDPTSRMARFYRYLVRERLHYPYWLILAGIVMLLLVYYSLVLSALVALVLGIIAGFRTARAVRQA
jgi:hypothetical protein